MADEYGKAIFGKYKVRSRHTQSQFLRLRTEKGRELSSNEMIDQRLDYIHNNPLKDGIVEKPEDYLYSSALDYAGGKGMLEIEFLINYYYGR